MFTVLHRRADGSEVLREDALSVSKIAQPVSNLSGDVVTAPGVVVRWSDGIETHYGEAKGSEEIERGAIFVMNRFGATVARYPVPPS